MEKKYYKSLDIIRVVSCIAVLLYHMGLLKGGYLAVCTFFVMSGYLSCISSSAKKHFSIKEYYLNRLKKIYIPLVFVVLSTVLITSFIKDFSSITFKREIISVLLGYNNFWQLNANLDYFARHISSPFMHFWYIGILLQFELIFPFVFILFNRIGDKFKRNTPIIIMGILTFFSMIVFIYACIKCNIMTTYYNTFTRAFSIMFGLFVGFYNAYYNRSTINFKNKKLNKLVFCLYLAILILLFIIIPSTSKLFSIAMLLTTIISCRMLEYGTIESSTKNKLLSGFSNISYEIYLWQYPVIFVFQFIKMDRVIEIVLIVLITIVLSIILNYAFKKQKKVLPLTIKYLVLSLFIFLSIYGLLAFIEMEDHTKEMNKLRKELAENEKILKEKQKAYNERMKQEKEELDKALNSLDIDEEELKASIYKLPIVGIGDSVMLGAVNKLYSTFPNGYFDAKQSRTAWEANGVLKSLKRTNTLGNPIIFNLGTNGDCTEACKDEIMKTCEGKDVFWVTVTNDNSVHYNDKITKYASKYDNSYIIDWNKASLNHPEYFVSDGIHLTTVGMNAYANTIYEALYQNTIDKINKKKEDLINKSKEHSLNHKTFYGNNLLLSINKYLDSDYDNYNINDYNVKTLIKKINTDIKNNEINNKVYFVFDKSFKISEEEYIEIINLLGDREIYIIEIEPLTINLENVHLIDFTDESNFNNNNITSQGKIVLKKILNGN